MKNLLPKDGHINLYRSFYELDQSQVFFEKLQREIPWSQKSIIIFGKKVAEPRLTAWFGESNAFYSYSGLNLSPLPWTPLLKKIQSDVQEKTGVTFNSVLLNLYRDGADSNGWHSDDEKELGDTPYIASLSFGETRDFLLRHKKESSRKLKIPLSSGSLLIMKGLTQKCWQHSLPKRAGKMGPRINLTFRQINPTKSSNSD